ncbi:fumarate reductase flavoprotein subunit [Anaerobacterium chartisolvens]|uniref:Fumarate reductase flavoprotein subunit n=1 Tax=Anaerobacterium chartisolvens TaxID=1297424 RepID=A0A369B5Y3_9FIRM|nr:FAD-dependent oxidoreductase [Anaerobacterium chartisolvens]RCX16028.1 fumarate reductase flavoprotein subunit [Anaerobacterium chartisolvens]
MRELECDIVVIAAGPAGLAAAISAAEREASVIVLEKSNATGGAGNMGMGPLGIETRYQKEQMIKLTKEEAFKKFMDYTHWRVDARLVREYLYKSGDTIQWLEDMGVEFTGASRYFADSEATWHIVKPESGRPGPRAASRMYKIMTQRAEELGVEILLETPAKKILKEDGRIAGVIAIDKNGEEVKIQCGAVVVATGGFGDNPEMIRQLTGYEWGKDMFSFRIPGITGDGIRMAREVGAGETEYNIEMAYGCPSENGYTTVVGIHMQPNLMVNLLGERFMNEEVLANTTFTSNILAVQKERCGFSIIDDSIKKYYLKSGIDDMNLVNHVKSSENYDVEIKDAVEKGDPYIFAADSIEELAEKTGIDAEALKKTVEEYNSSCKERDFLFNKNYRYMRPLVGPKFYAVKFYPGGYGSLGGIKINYRTEAVTNDFQVIAGLYAAGTDACSIYGDSYVFVLPGNTMGFALNSGRMAGENAVEYLLKLYAED